MDKSWKRRLSTIKCIECGKITYELVYNNEIKSIPGRIVEYDPKSKILGISHKAKLRNPLKFLGDLSKAISRLLFIGDIPRAKLVSPLIEKLLQSDSKIDTLKELGYSTFKLETKKLSVPKVNLKLPAISESFQNLPKNPSLTKSPSLYDNLPIISQDYQLPPIDWSPKQFNLIEKHYSDGRQKTSNSSKRIASPNGLEHIDIIVKKPPSRNQFVKYVKNSLNKTFGNGQLSNEFTISSQTKRTLKRINQSLYESMEFPGRAVYGGLDITPPIPKLKLERYNGFYYYKQEGLKVSVEPSSLQKFQKMLRFIVKSMEGKPETVSVAVFNTPVNAFNFKGQLIFNYLLMLDDSLKIPLFLIWMFIAAHELAHNISQNHDQLHSKYMMIFAIRGIQKLQNITDKYREIFN